ncbi:MAG: AAA family ATPase [Clostridia bacterium]|nr:AAA family ATPase [Clostridia bacterium]
MIAELPAGSISRKTINGKVYFYHQWQENGRTQGYSVSEEEAAEIKIQIERRRALQKELRALEKKKNTTVPTPSNNDLFKTVVVFGDNLASTVESVKRWRKRSCYYNLIKYLDAPVADRVCLVYGLRRTGKTTMLRQAIADMSKEKFAKCAYIKARTSDTMADINHDLKTLSALGYKYIFIDEVTLMQDFVDSAALFSDVFAAQGMKIVLSGTDSLGFWFAANEELYDRATMIHTTWISFKEHSYLLGINDIDEYIRYGGTLRVGETNFGDATPDDASFRDDESSRRYIDTAIARNIQHSLSCYKDGEHFKGLYELYQNGELTGAINRIIEDMNHAFLLSVLDRDFESHDYGEAASNLRRARDVEKRTDILDRINGNDITSHLMQILEIRNKNTSNTTLTEAHVSEIKAYLKVLDLIEASQVLSIFGGAPTEYTIFTQPGMRFCQAQALVYSLMQNSEFLSTASEYEKTLVTNKILDSVRGRMMEDIVLLETAKSLSKRYRVFKLTFLAGEFDMVIYDTENNSCEIYEIKHSKERVSQQYRHINDPEKLAETERKYGRITKRAVIYRGDAYIEENGVEYINVEDYLKSLY